MRKRLQVLGRLLPDEAAREWFLPSLLELEAAWAARRATRVWIRRRSADAAFAISAVLLWVECLRLAAIATVISYRSSPCQPSRSPEYSAMIVRDIRHALRLFRRDPVFTGAAVLTLALGIGANTALFAIVEAVLLRPLPFAGDEVLMLRYRDTRTGFSKDFVALGDIVDLRTRSQSFEAVVPFSNVQAALIGEQEAVRVEGVSAGPELFQTLRVEPLIGRFFEPDDAREGSPEIVVISHSLWTTRFGSAPNAVGRSVQIGTTRRTVVGVAPKGFRFPPSSPTDIIVPMRLPAAAPAERRIWVHALARLRPHVTIAQANIELAAISRQFEMEFPASNTAVDYDALSVRDALIGDTKRALLLLLGAVGFVLLIACANVGNLLIARSLARRDEMTIRMALGAGRARLLAQMLVEGVVLAAAGGTAGIVLAWKAAPALATLVPRSRPIPGLEDVSLNAAVLVFSCGVSLVAALLFSGLAAFGLTGSTADVAATKRTTASAGARRAASVLVAAEVAIAAVLLIAAGLTLRSVANLMTSDPGFNGGHVVTVQVALPPGRYKEAPARHDLFLRALSAVAAVRGVEAAGAGVVTPLTGNNWTIPLERPEQPLGPGERPPDVGWQLASAGYFRALKIPLRAGRLFDERDRPGAPPVVIVSESLAARYFPGEDALGRRVVLGENTAEIVGVVGDIRRASLDDTPRADMYLPFEHDPASAVGLFIRTSGDPVAALPSVQAALRAIEPQMIFYGVRSMDDIAAQSAAVTQLAMRVLGGFAGVALVLAGVGIYGVISYSVRRRTREMGTRLALGASRRDIVRLVMYQAAAVAGAGLLVGLLSGLMAARMLGSILYGVPPWDPFVLGGAAGILLAVALAAGYVPARRAARVDPARALATD
jgi:putative ABC transport system permease protein